MTSYKVTTTCTLEVQMTRVREATHFMQACNGIDEDRQNHPADVLRREGFIVDLKQTKHNIDKLS